MGAEMWIRDRLCTEDDCTRASRPFSAAKKANFTRSSRVLRYARDDRDQSAQKSASKRLHITCGLLPECWDVSSEAAATNKAHLRKEASEVGGCCRGGRRDAGQGCKARRQARASIHVQAHGRREAGDLLVGASSRLYPLYQVCRICILGVYICIHMYLVFNY